MTEDITKYARLGLVHHMLHSKTLVDPVAHYESLSVFAASTDIETLDCCLPYDDDLQEKLGKVLRESGKANLVFAIHLFPLRKLSPSSTSYVEQAQCRMIIADMVRQAATMGASGFIIASGGPPEAEATSENYHAFADFCRWLCRQLLPHGITALLEPFDMDFDKAFMLGSTKRCVKLAHEIREEFPNFAIELDMAHLPLMREGFREAIETCAPVLGRVHLGNCSMRDKSDIFYGDNHPPIGYHSGEIDVPQVTEQLQALLDVGYLSKENRGDVVLELNAFPNKTVEESIKDNLKRLRLAWEDVQLRTSFPQTSNEAEISSQLSPASSTG